MVRSGPTASLLPLTESTYLILCSLMVPRHGYAIMQWVAEASAQRVKLGPGTLYGALTSLHDKGLIRPEGERVGEGERRKVYALTPEGASLIVLELARLEQLQRIGQEALASREG